MSVEFLNNNFNINTVRPTGYKWPYGLSIAPTSGNLTQTFAATETFHPGNP